MRRSPTARSSSCASTAPTFSSSRTISGRKERRRGSLSAGEDMNGRTRFIVGALLVFVGTTSSRAPAAAQQGAGRPKWDVRINETRGPLRAADRRPLANTAASEVLAGPTNGSDYGYLIFTRMPAAARGPSLFTL